MLVATHAATVPLRELHKPSDPPADPRDYLDASGCLQEIYCSSSHDIQIVDSKRLTSLIPRCSIFDGEKDRSAQASVPTLTQILIQTLMLFAADISVSARRYPVCYELEVPGSVAGSECTASWPPVHHYSSNQQGTALVWTLSRPAYLS
jgi:hypothetical protein